MKMIKPLLTLLLTLCAFTSNLNAQQNLPQTYMENPQTVGQYNFKYMIWNVYEAKLTAPNGTWQDNIKSGTAFALALTYKRNFKSRQIVNRTLTEMRNLGYQNDDQLNGWATELRNIIPDVQKGTTITGIQDADRHTLFYHNNKFLGEISDPAFTQAFFEIWLAPNTSQPKMRKALLGLL